MSEYCASCQLFQFFIFYLYYIQLHWRVILQWIDDKFCGSIKYVGPIDLQDVCFKTSSKLLLFQSWKLHLFCWLIATQKQSVSKKRSHFSKKGLKYLVQSLTFFASQRRTHQVSKSKRLRNKKEFCTLPFILVSYIPGLVWDLIFFLNLSQDHVVTT